VREKEQKEQKLFLPEKIFLLLFETANILKGRKKQQIENIPNSDQQSVAKNLTSDITLRNILNI
jgi:hypothetical protein